MTAMVCAKRTPYNNLKRNFGGAFCEMWDAKRAMAFYWSKGNSFQERFERKG